MATATATEQKTQLLDAENPARSLAPTVEEQTKQLAIFQLSPQKLAIMKSQFSGLKADTKEKYEIVRLAIQTTREARTACERRREELVAESVSWQKHVNHIAKWVKDFLFSIENPLKLTKQAVDDEADRLVREKKAKEEAAAKALKDAADAKERADREAERKRLADAAAKLAADRKKFEDEQAAERQKLADEQAKIDAANRKLDAERQRLAQIEADRVAKERAEREAIEAKYPLVETEAAKPVTVDLSLDNFDIPLPVHSVGWGLPKSRPRIESPQPTTPHPDVAIVRGFAGQIRVSIADLISAIPPLDTAESRNFIDAVIEELQESATDCERFTMKGGM